MKRDSERFEFVIHEIEDIEQCNGREPGQQTLKFVTLYNEPNDRQMAVHTPNTLQTLAHTPT